MKLLNAQPIAANGDELIGVAELPVMRSSNAGFPALVDVGGPAAQFAWEVELAIEKGTGPAAERRVLAIEKGTAWDAGMLNWVK